jgi:hypothetical protein
VNFRVYVRKQGTLIKLWDIRRTPTGLYFQGERGPSYVTYHEDGAYWSRAGTLRMVRKRRPPLASLQGPYTFSTGTFTILAPSLNDRKESDVRLRPEDIVVDEYPYIFGAELILSDTVPHLELMAERPNSQVFTKPNLTPVITFEFFDNPMNMLPIGRFPDVPTLDMAFHDEDKRI